MEGVKGNVLNMLSYWVNRIGTKDSTNAINSGVGQTRDTIKSI